MPELSFLIPARNEQFLSRTVEDLLTNMRADSEIIVVLDGAWADPPLPQHERLKVVYVPEAIGQRAATNLAACISRADYVCKVDAHVSIAEGMDRVLIDAAKELGPDVTQIPAQKNLAVYNRVCPCGRREYHGRMESPCVVCGKAEWTMEMVWKPREGTTTRAWSFSAEPKFDYWGEYKERVKGQKIYDVMTSLGACFFMARERFWQLGGLDEQHGSWGSFGIEIACKSWLSGGRHVCNSNTWFAHLFRVGGLSFPYPIHESDQARARQYSRDLWFNDRWDGQVRPLRWLIEKFWPVKGWTEEQRNALPDRLHRGIAGHAAERDNDAGVSRAVATVRGGTVPTRGVVFYTDNRIDPGIADAVRACLDASGLPIVAVSLRPLDWVGAKNLVLCDAERGYLTMFRQILVGLEASDADVVFFAEHDVAYHPSHFDFTPPDPSKVYFNQHVWKVDAESGRALHYRCSQTSGLCASRDLLVEHYRKRVALVEARGFSRNMGFEPGTHGRPERVDDLRSDVWMSEFPNIDIRHGHCLTKSRWSKAEFRNQKYTEGWTEASEVPGWGRTAGRFQDFLAEVRAGAVQQAVA